MNSESRVVNCRGCGGTGQQGPFNPVGRPGDCIVCAGSGKKRMNPGDTWCGRCGGTGREQGGFPGFETLRVCHICGGDGTVQV